MYRPRYLRNKNEKRLVELPKLVVEHREITNFVATASFERYQLKHLKEDVIKRKLISMIISENIVDICDMLEFNSEYSQGYDRTEYRAVLSIGDRGCR